MKWQYQLEFQMAEYSSINATLYVRRETKDVTLCDAEYMREVQGFEPDELWYPWKWHGQDVVGDIASAEKYPFHIHFEIVHLSKWLTPYEVLLKIFNKAMHVKDTFSGLRFMLRFTCKDIDVRFELNAIQNYYYLITYADSVLQTLQGRYDETVYAYEQWDSSTQGQVR